MPADVRLTPHFFLSQLTVSPLAGRAGMRNQPLGAQFENLHRLAQALEVVRSNLGGCQVCVLRALRQAPLPIYVGDSVVGEADLTAAHGRSAEFIAPEFGSPRDICAHLVAQGFAFDRLVNAGGWVQLDIPKFGQAPRLQLQTGVFEYRRPMRYLEGLL
jgi:zinc D-Ala-D-Ala carboxypeptidase